MCQRRYDAKSETPVVTGIQALFGVAAKQMSVGRWNSARWTIWPRATVTERVPRPMFGAIFHDAAGKLISNRFRIAPGCLTPRQGSRVQKW